MFQYLPKGFQFLPKPSSEIKKRYDEFMEKYPKGYLIYPIFMYDADAMKEKGKTIDECMIPIFSGNKTKSTREWMEGFKEYILQHRMIDLDHMHRQYFYFMTETIGGKQEKKYEKDKALILQGNYMRRMNVASLVSRSKPCTRIDWNECFKHLRSMTLESYAQLMDFAMELPKEWCDDQKI